MSDVTRILNEIQQGNRASANELLPLVYAELRRLAGNRMRQEAAGQTLQPTALVHEAFLRLVGDAAVEWDGRSHFFAAAAEAMRRILIENARRRKSAKRGGDARRHPISDADAIADAIADADDLDDLLDLDAALTKLAADEPALAKLVELRFFAGLTIEESANTLGVSVRTVTRNWAFVRAWLGREMKSGEKD
ncbi:ECF sigma factor [Stieleria maiorica]|uniref:ECF sigma factor n=1 Tax=Stieleria maiorica TaxID=2795974 RepID=A0A5B9MCW3_9BACT|nr:sigma-70 family RNA polymerase sigma factor [Stieleria maiorica]QEF97464.1 ECF sigma factor [Stieleria maiorica]